jgi:WD40 repeat protein
MPFRDAAPAFALGFLLLGQASDSGLFLEPPKHERRILQKLRSTVYSVGFGADGKMLAASSLGVVQVWDTKTWKEVVTLNDFKYQVGSVAFSPDGKTLATAGAFDECARLYDTATWKVRARLRPEFLVEFSTDGKKLLTGGEKSTVTLWDPAEGKEVVSFRWPDPPLASVTLSRDGKTVAGGGFRTALMYDLKAKKVQCRLEGHVETTVKTVVFSPDGKTLLTAEEGLPGKGNAFLWDRATGHRKLELNLRKAKLPLVKGGAFSPDGKIVALVGGLSSDVHLFDTNSGEECASLKSSTGDTWNECVAYSPDGRMIVTGCADGTCKVWDVPKRKEANPPR